MNDNEPQHAPAEQERRNFLLEAGAVFVGAITGLVPAIMGGVFFLTPLIRKKEPTPGVAEDGFSKVGSTGGLTPDGPPQMFQVTGIKKDAWTTYPETEIGAVYVQMQQDGGLVCFNASCPHLGCSVKYKQEEEQFICPCHDSAFGLSGERKNDIPPRNLDPLEVEVRNGTEVWVKFQNYRAGTSKQELV